MLNTSAPEGSVWDNTRPRETSTAAPGMDDLPPFVALTTDKEREKKAKYASPGTYNVVVDPKSFQHLPAYSNDPSSISLHRTLSVTSTESSHGQEFCIAHGLDDPNVIILSRFEDFSLEKSRSLTSSQPSPSEVDVPDSNLMTTMEDIADVILWNTRRLEGSLFNPKNTSGANSSIYTNFFVDHTEPLAALEWVREGLDWPLGGFLDGYEFLFMTENRHGDRSRSRSASQPRSKPDGA